MLTRRASRRRHERIANPADPAGVGGEEGARGDVAGCHMVEVKTGFDECEAELVEEVIEGLVRGEGGNVEVVSESLK